MKNFDYYTISTLDDSYSVYGWGTYERSSVLAGQARKVFLESYDTEKKALKAYPSALFSSKWIEPQTSCDHLPGENDPVAGGMYLDDWDDGI